MDLDLTDRMRRLMVGWFCVAALATFIVPIGTFIAQRVLPECKFGGTKLMA